MVRKRAENGTYYHEPPYTEEEEFELYRMMDLKEGATILRGSPPAATPAPPRKSPHPPQEE